MRRTASRGSTRRRRLWECFYPRRLRRRPADGPSPSATRGAARRACVFVVARRYHERATAAGGAIGDPGPASRRRRANESKKIISTPRAHGTPPAARHADKLVDDVRRRPRLCVVGEKRIALRPSGPSPSAGRTHYRSCPHKQSSRAGRRCGPRRASRSATLQVSRGSCAELRVASPASSK